MSKTETNDTIRLDQGSTALLIRQDRARIVTRGATLEFNTVRDLENFASEINILMVMLASEMEKKPPTTEETPTSGTQES